MSIDNVFDNEPRDQYTASASQTAFTYSFAIFVDSDLVVYDNDTLMALSTDYTVSGAGDDNGGTVTFVVGRTAGHVITIYRDLPIERTTDFQQNGPNLSASMNDELDRITLVQQQLASEIGRSLRVTQRSIATSADTEIDSTWAECYVWINADGVPEPAADLGTTVLSQSVIGTLLYPRTPAEISAVVTPTNYQYEPGHLYRYGTNTTPGTTDMSTAFASAALVSATHPMILPHEDMRLNTGFALPTRGEILGGNKWLSRIMWYGTGLAIRQVGTVNVGGSNLTKLKDFCVVCCNDDNDGVGLLFGGKNLLQRIRFISDGTNRFRACVITDQTILTVSDGVDYEGYKVAGILGPYNGEYTTYGTTVSSYVTTLVVKGFGQFNNLYAGSIGVAMDRGETIIVKETNFNAVSFPVRVTKAVTNVSVQNNYFERVEADYNSSTNRGPALLVAGTSTLSAASVTGLATGVIEFCGNHIDLRQRGAPDNDGVVEINDGYDGTIRVSGNEFQQGFSHCVYVSGGTVKKLVFTRDNERLTADEAVVDDGFKKSVYIAVGATVTQLHDETATKHYLPSTVKEFGWDGQKLIFASAVPTSSGGSALEGQTVAAGDRIYLEDGTGELRVTGPGTFGTAGVLTGAISNGSNLLTLSAAGNVDEGCRITIVGVTGVKTVKQRYNDGSPRILLDSNSDATVSGATVAFQAPVLAPHVRSGSGSPEGAITAPPGSIYLNTSGGTDTSMYTKGSGTGNTGWIAVDNV